jgi:hypothetical protein
MNQEQVDYLLPIAAPIYAALLLDWLASNHAAENKPSDLQRMRQMAIEQAWQLSEQALAMEYPPP